MTGRELRAQAEAQVAPPAHAGWKWVPVEPTQAMNNAGLSAVNQYGKRSVWETYAAMLAAAPAAPQAEPKHEPVSEATALIEWPESAKWKNRAALEGVERSCMGEPKRDELLEALHQLIAVIGLTAIKYKSDLDILQAAVDEASAAIAKAEGRQRC